MSGLRTRAVPEVSSADPDALLRAIATGRPVKVHGLTAGWAASDWTFERLRGMAGGHPVTAMIDLPRRGGVLRGGQEAYEQEMTFAEFLDRAGAADLAAPCYLGYTRPTDLIPGYETAFDFTPLTPHSPDSTDTRLWIGSAGTCSGLHSDLKDNVFAQVRGRKVVVLVPFAQTPRVYPFVDNIVNSRVDPEDVDLAAFPRFADATVYRTVVGPGDVLHIPRGWWHYLRSETPSISVNHWFGPQIPARTFLLLLLRLGPRHLGRALADAVRYPLLGKTYPKDFFFTPPSTGERLYSLLRFADFSRDNDPSSVSGSRPSGAGED